MTGPVCRRIGWALLAGASLLATTGLTGKQTTGPAGKTWSETEEVAAILVTFGVQDQAALDVLSGRSSHRAFCRSRCPRG